MDNLAALSARDDLLYVVAQWPALTARLRPGGGNGLTGMPRAKSKPLPIDVHVSDLMADIEKTTRFYARIMLDEIPPVHGCGGTCHGAPEHICKCPPKTRPLTGEECWEREYAIKTSTMPGLLLGVAMRYGHFTSEDDEMARGFCDDANDYRHKVRKALEQPAAPTYLGPCALPNCDGQLYIRGDSIGSGRCPACGTDFSLESQRAWLADQFDQRLMTLGEIASAFVTLDIDVPYRTLQSWARRGKLTPDQDGLYRIRDAKTLADKRKAAA